MHTPSTRILSAVAYDCGIEDYDPTDPVCLELVDALSMAEHAHPVLGEPGPFERARHAGAGAPAAQAGAGVVLGRGPDRRTVGDRRAAVHLICQPPARALALGPARVCEGGIVSKHPSVLFTEPNEFVAEIVRDQQRGLVERGIVRVTKVGRPVMNGTITRVTVEAAAVVDSRCVRLRHPCGDLWGMDADEQVQRRASELVRQLESDLLDGGLEVRAGVYDED